MRCMLLPCLSNKYTETFCKFIIHLTHGFFYEFLLALLQMMACSIFSYLHL